MGTAINEYLRIEIENLIEEAYALLPEIIEATRPSDIRAKSQNAKWWDRHRFHVLLDIAEQTKQKLSRNVVVAPWFLAELKATIEMIEKWKDDPKWKDIEPSLTNKDHFTHTIGKLRIAEHFMKSDHKAEIVPRSKEASPDLRVQAIGGTQDWLYIECYQPNVLTGEPREIPENVLDKIVDRSMDKSKRQFRKKHPEMQTLFKTKNFVEGDFIVGVKFNVKEPVDIAERVKKDGMRISHHRDDNFYLYLSKKSPFAKPSMFKGKKYQQKFNANLKTMR